MYSGAKEEDPHDIPEPKGKHVTTTTYVDANQHRDQVTDRTVSACLHLVNALLLIGTPKDKVQLKLQLLDLNLWQLELLQTRLLISDKP